MSHIIRRPHPSNNSDFRPTPDFNKSRPPTEGELLSFQNGPDRFPDLARFGSFWVWPLEGLFLGVTLRHDNFNCFAWSLGHTDRWIEAAPVEDITRIFEHYHFVTCQPADAEVELYRILDAPPMLVNARGRSYRNNQANVRHAHRRRRPHGAPSNLDCSSKLADEPLIAHNRRALEDTRPYGSRNPRVNYGSIYQYWRRTLEHPSHPGKEGNVIPSTGHYPDHPMFALGYGEHPPGHPGNTIGLPGYGGNNTSYAQVPQMRAHDPIPLPSQGAKDSAFRAYDNIRKSSPKLVMDFHSKFSAWQRSWHSTGGRSSAAKDRCNVAVFSELLKMGRRILPLVVYMLLDRRNFTAVFLYNALEQDTKYLINPRDVLNFLVLQRQNNLIIDLNKGRMWPKC